MSVEPFSNFIPSSSPGVFYADNIIAFIFDNLLNFL